jgi:hypothetical protein
MMIGFKPDGSGFEKPGRFFRAISPAFKEHSADHGTPLGAAHLLPIDGRAGMKDHSILESGNDFSGWCDVDQDGFCGIDSSYGLRICSLYLLFDTR